MPLLNILKQVNDGMGTLVENTFGRVLVCRDIDKALKTARHHKIDCVTFDGDVVGEIEAHTFLDAEFLFYTDKRQWSSHWWFY